MPRVPYVTQADWDAVFLIRIRDASHPQHQQKISYGRLAAGRMTGPYDDDLTEFTTRVASLTRLFGIQAVDRIMVAGCGLGYLLEAFKAAGCANCWGLDDSAYVDTSKTGESDDPDAIMSNADIKNVGQLTDDLIQETGGSDFTWVISESVLEGYDDGLEMASVLDNLEVLLEKNKSKLNIIHMIVTIEASVDPMFNQKTLAAWKAVRPTHSWLDYVRGRGVVG